MPANTAPIFPESPIVGIASIGGTTIISRSNIVGTTGLTQLTATSTDGTRVDRIEITATTTTSACLVWVWVNDGTNSYLVDEIAVSAVTPNTTTTIAATTFVDYTTMVLPSTYRLFVSTTVAQTMNVVAYGGIY
jgi:hypothetical protein